MYQDAINQYGVLAAARKASLISQEEMASKLACSSTTMVEYEKNPKKLTLERLGKFYECLGTDGRAMVKEFVLETFLP